MTTPIRDDLVTLAEGSFTFLTDHDGNSYAEPKQPPRVLRSLRGGKDSLRRWLTVAYAELHGRTPPQNALADALGHLEALAGRRDPVPVALRVAEVAGVRWLDLGDSTGRAVMVGPYGWTVTADGVPRFRRTALTGVLPAPVAGGDLGDLWVMVNVQPLDRPLVLAWLVSVLLPDIPHPILGLFGEQGTGKSTAGRMIAALLDPSPAQLRKPPRDAESWVTAAAGSHVVALDNLSTFPDWLSDSLCRASTGDGDVRRRLYSDSDLTVFAFRRCPILTGIDLGATRGDLGERLLPVQLSVIDDEHRQLDEALATSFRRTHPLLLGAVLDLAVDVLANMPNLHVDRLPRMADFGLVLASLDKVTGSAGFDHYGAVSRRIAVDAVALDPFVSALMRVVVRDFAGSGSDLLALVNGLDPVEHVRDRPKDWPTTGRQATAALRRNAPGLRRAGWAVADSRETDRHLTWDLRPPAPVRDNSWESALRAGERVDPAPQTRTHRSPPPLLSLCQVCGERLDQALLDLGEEAHPGCQP